MATVKMKRGSLMADIYDSPETIAQAESEGFELVQNSDEVEKATDSDSPAEEVEKSAKRGRK